MLNILFKNVLILLLLNLALTTPISAQNTTQHNFNLAKQKIHHLPQSQRHGIKKFKFGHTIYQIKIKQSPYQNLTKQQIEINEQQLKQQTFTDINHKRKQHHKRPVKYNFKLSQLAHLRAVQIVNHFSHYSSHGKPMTNVDAKQVHLPEHFQGAENIATSGLGYCTDEHNPTKYYNHNGKQMANSANDSMMNFDQFEHNGHRKNILSSNNTLIGIGTTYNIKKHTFYLAEDFGNKNNDDSEDIKPFHENPNKITNQSKPNHQDIRTNRNAIKQSWNNFLKECIKIWQNIVNFIMKL